MRRLTRGPVFREPPHPGHTRFLELVRPKLAVLERRERTGVVAGGDVSLGQSCCSRMSTQPRLADVLAILMAV